MDRFYTTRYEAVEHEVLEALGDAVEDFDIIRIADELIDHIDGLGYFCMVEPAEFWEIVQRYDVSTD